MLGGISMNFTIATLTEHNMGYGHLVLNIDCNGREYLVGLYNDETKEYTHRVFKTLNHAFDMFEQLSEWIIKSEYSEADKRKYLLTNEID